MKHQLLYGLSLYVLFIGSASAQSSLDKTESLSKERFSKAVMENNPTLKIAAAETLAAQGDYRQTQAVLLPTISVANTLMATNNPLMAFGFGLQQAQISAADFNPVSLNNPKQTNDFSTVLSVQQPLINLDGILKRKASKQAYEATALKELRTQAYLKLLIEKSYMQLQLAHQSVGVFEAAYTSAQAHYKIAQDRFEAGHLLKSDVLSIAVMVGDLRAKLLAAKQQTLSASNALGILMNVPLGVVYNTTDDLKWKINEQLFEYMPHMRPDIQALDLGVLARKSLYQAEKLSFLPSLNAFGTYEFHDSDFLGTQGESYFVGAQLKWNLFNGGQKIGAIQASKALFNKATQEAIQYKNESEQLFSQATEALEVARIQLENNALAISQIEEVLDITRNRFKTGLAANSDILEAQAQWEEKSLAYALATFNYNYTQAYLTFLTQQ